MNSTSLEEDKKLKDMTQTFKITGFGCSKTRKNTFTISCQYQKNHSLDGIDWWAIVITWRRLQLFDTVCFLQNAAPGQGSDDVRLRCVAALNVARRELLEVKRTGGLLHLLLLLGDAGDVRVL